MNSPDYTQAEIDKIYRAAYFWNTFSGLLVAFQSVIILIVLTRVCDVVTAGIFTFAYANGNLFLNMGKYGMRQFQASDRNFQYSFADYRTSRIITTAAMIAFGGAYILFLTCTNGYVFEKAAVIVVLCLYEAVAAFEDVYMGNYQQHGRLDVGARLLTLRYLTTISLICILIVLTKSLLIASVIATLYTSCFVVAEVRYAHVKFGLPSLDGAFSRKRLFDLLRTCFPLFAAAFLLFYIGNAPRYAIDALMNDTAQAYYGYIAMPVFIVTLLASFIYNPMIASLTDEWNSRQVTSFQKHFFKLVGVIALITLACDAAAFLLGVPVLDLLYNADTQPYLIDLLILVTGGGFLALASLMVLGITIIRFHRVLVPVYCVMAIVAWLASTYAVGSWGIDGAAFTYLCCMIVLAAAFALLFALGVKLLSRQ